MSRPVTYRDREQVLLARGQPLDEHSVAAVIHAHVGKTWMTPTADGFATRDHRMAYSPGEEDLAEARRVADLIESEHPTLSAEVTNAEEWVFVTLWNRGDACQT